MNNSFVAAEEVARLVLSAAIQSPTPATLAILGGIPREAFKYFPEIQSDVDLFVTALMLDEGEAQVSRFNEKYGTDADPWRLAEYVDDLLALSGKTGPEPEANPKPPALVFSDMRRWKSMSKELLPSAFEGAMPLKSLAVIAAEPGVGKSYLSLILALSVVLNREFIPGFKPTSTGGALMLFAEDSDHVVSQRLAAIAEAHEIAEYEIDEAIESGLLKFSCGHPARLLDFGIGGIASPTDAHRELIEVAARDKPVLVIADPLISWCGVPDENSNNYMHDAAQCLIGIAEAAGGVALAIHHSSKGGVRAGEMTMSLARGASSLSGACRWMATMRAFDGDDCKSYGIDPERAPSYAEIAIAKNNYAGYSGRRTTLERGPGGALRYVDLKTLSANEAAASLLPAVVAAITEMPLRLTISEIERKTGDFAIRLRKKIDEKAGRSVSNPDVRRVIEQGIDAGLLRSEVRETGGPKRYEIVPVNCA